MLGIEWDLLALILSFLALILSSATYALMLRFNELERRFLKASIDLLRSSLPPELQQQLDWKSIEQELPIPPAGEGWIDRDDPPSP